MSRNAQKPPIAMKKQSKPAPQGAPPPESEPKVELAPRPAEPPRAANLPAGQLAEEISSGPVETALGYPNPDPKAGLSDQQWLETLPLYAQLKGLSRRIFAEDALTYRRLWATRKAIVAAFHEAQIAHAASRRADSPRSPSRRRGEFQGRTWAWIKLNNPENWGLCPPREGGGCGGTGMVGAGRCRFCRGNGYLVGHIHDSRKASD
jgi:hypothetical protein